MTCSGSRSRKAPRQLFHEQVSAVGFIDYNGAIAVHSSLLNVLHDQPQIKI